MKQLRIIPTEFECTLAECPPGLFVRKGALCMKTKYSHNGKIEAFVDSGEWFAGGAADEEERESLLVIPCRAVWEDVDP